VKAARSLAFLADVRPGEAARLMTAAAAMFFLMTSYYILKVIRSSTFLDEFGPYYLLFTYYGNALLTLAAVFLYNRVITRFPRATAVVRVYAAVGLVFGCVWLLNRLDVAPRLMTLINYFSVCVYILILTSLLWSLVHDVFSPDEAKRLYGVILLAGQAGVVLAGKVTELLAAPLGTMNLVPIGLLFLGLTFLAVRRLETFEVRTRSEKPSTSSTNALADLGGLLRHPYARLIGFLVICNTFCLTTVDWQVNNMLKTAIVQPDARTEFYGLWMGRLGICNIVLLLIAGQVIARFGPASAMVGLPFMAMAAAGSTLTGQTLPVVAAFWILCQSMSYTLFNAGKENLYVPTERVVRYRYKALNDAAGYRFGDATAATSILFYLHGISATATAGIGVATLLVGTAICGLTGFGGEWLYDEVANWTLLVHMAGAPLFILGLTGLAVLTSIIRDPASLNNVQGKSLSKAAFAHIPVIGPAMLAIGLFTFVFSTILGWEYYGERSAEYLLGKKAIKPYRYLWILFVFLGAVAALPLVWDLADAMNALMAIPNLISLLLLCVVVVSETRKYLWEERLNEPAPQDYFKEVK